MSPSAQNPTVRFSWRKWLSAAPMCCWCWLKPKLLFLERFCTVSLTVKQDYGAPREEVLSVLGENLA